MTIKPMLGLGISSFGQRGMNEMTYLVGVYSMVAITLNALTSGSGARISASLGGAITEAPTGWSPANTNTRLDRAGSRT